VTSLRATDFELASCQASLFTPDEEISSSRLLKALLPVWGDVFDGEPTVLPAGAGFPKEVPRVLLVSKSGEWRCQVASSRLDMHWHRAAAGPAGEFFFRAAELLTVYVKLIGTRVGRVAAIVNRYAYHDQPASFLARHFCKPRWNVAPLNRPEQFELHAHKTYRMAAATTVNSWVRSKTGIVATDGGEQPAVIVQQDLNSLVGDAPNKSFAEGELRSFFEAVTMEFDQILELYYPGDEGQ
jgi:hypothetical protein